MTDAATLLFTLGALLLLGLATDSLGRFTHLPRVTLLLLFGVAAGPYGFSLLPAPGDEWFSLITHTALVMVGFLLGERFTRAALLEQGRSVLVISATAVLVTAVCVTGVLVAAGAPIELALLLGAISTSTAPAATIDVVDQEETDTPFTRKLLGIVALDDGLGLVFFALVAAAVGARADAGSVFVTSAAEGAREVGGALLLGGVLGAPLSFLTGRLRPGEPTLLEALGAVFLCAGLALWLHVSPLLAAMALGATVANLARHHERPFHAIEGVERPFLIVFFVFAGALLDFRALEGVGAIGLVYVGGRAMGRWLGGWVGSTIAGELPAVRQWIGLALMPQAGVALGLAIIAAERFAPLRDVLLPVVVASTVVFEVLGPMCTRAAVRATA